MDLPSATNDARHPPATPLTGLSAPVDEDPSLHDLGVESTPETPAQRISNPPETPAVFAPPAEHWERLSPRLITVRRISLSITLGILTAVPTGVAAFLAPSAWVAVAIGGAGVALWLFLWLRTPRVVQSWGYAERDADLCITHGLWSRELIVVPFGRMQVVKVSSGPLTRAFGLASVELVTASPATGASIPGLPLDDARVLRDRMIELSDAKGSGL